MNTYEKQGEGMSVMLTRNPNKDSILSDPRE